ncbi:MAG: hypothetical protein M3Q43_00930 [Actinomycetota bacterium]|jgi:hypothetical protein|nr:hypothetical protein [Actinomycetota bacterium]
MARTRRPRLAAVAAVAALCGLAPTACGGEAPGEVVARTQDNLARIRSGDLDAKLVIAAEGPKRTGATGFELRGPFELARSAGDLPKARIAYTQIAGSRRATVTLVSTGERAYIEVRGKAYELTSDQERQLREEGGPLGGGSGSGTGGATASPTGSLDLAAWLREPDLSAGERIGGAETDRVTGEVDVASVVTDVLGAAERLGVPREAVGGGALRGAGDERLDRAVSASSIELLTGREDRLLRRLQLGIKLDAKAAAGGGASLGDVEAVRVDLELAIERPNTPVRVDAPRDARPASELSSSSG